MKDSSSLLFTINFFIIGYFVAQLLFERVAKFVFSMIFTNIQIKRSNVKMVAQLLILFGFIFCVVNAVTGFLDLNDNVKQKADGYITIDVHFLEEVSIFLFVGMGFFLLNLLIQEGGYMVLADNVIRKKGKILLLRRFRNERIKKIIEDVLPIILNHYGQYTIIEIHGEYKRSELDEEVIVDIGFPDIPLRIPFFNYSEIYLGKIERKHFLDKEWKELFINELENSQFVVIDLSDYSENVMWEISQIHKLLGASKIIFIASDSKSCSWSLNRYRAVFSNSDALSTFEPIFYPGGATEDYKNKINGFKRRLNAIAMFVSEKTGDSA